MTCKMTSPSVCRTVLLRIYVVRTLGVKDVSYQALIAIPTVVVVVEIAIFRPDVVTKTAVPLVLPIHACNAKNVPFSDTVPDNAMLLEKLSEL